MSNFIIGAACGLAVALIIAIYFSMKLSTLRKEKKTEVEKYRNMLAERMEIESAGVNKLKAENEELRKTNENLRVSLLAMREKPGRKELERLQVMHLMPFLKRHIPLKTSDAQLIDDSSDTTV